MSDFAPRLIAWQQHHGRSGLPWQGQGDPYRVWLSEIMLQQTQVATVVGYYTRFLARFPTVVELASVPLAGYRAPVRPLPLKVIAETAEPADLKSNWDVWFGVPEQWVPYPDIGTAEEPDHVAYISAAKYLK